MKGGLSGLAPGQDYKISSLGRKIDGKKVGLVVGCIVGAWILFALVVAASAKEKTRNRSIVAGSPIGYVQIKSAARIAVGGAVFVD